MLVEIHSGYESIKIFRKINNLVNLSNFTDSISIANFIFKVLMVLVWFIFIKRKI